MLTITTTCDFERGGAKKPTTRRAVLDLYQVQKCSNVILLIVFVDYNVFKRLSYRA